MLVIEFIGKPVSVNQRYYKNFSLTSKYRAYKQLLGYKAKEVVKTSPWAKEVPMAGFFRVTIALFYKGRTPDIDNYAKVILDSLTGIVWKDDIQVNELLITRLKTNIDKIIITIERL